MRSLPCLTAGLALVSLLPAVGVAQDQRPFSDSWFWGAKAGAMTVKTNTDSKAAPVIGTDWLITRSRTGLYISIEEGIFSNTFGAVADASLGSGVRPVELRNFRRAAFALLAFPHQWGTAHPYAGVGLSLNLVQRAVPVGNFSSADAQTEVIASIEDRRSRTSAVFMGGVQGQFNNLALFAQATAMPTGSRFLISGNENIYMLEAGVRFNLGSAIERIDR